MLLETSSEFYGINYFYFIVIHTFIKLKTYEHLFFLFTGKSVICCMFIKESSRENLNTREIMPCRTENIIWKKVPLCTFENKSTCVNINAWNLKSVNLYFYVIQKNEWRNFWYKNCVQCTEVDILPLKICLISFTAEIT